MQLLTVPSASAFAPIRRSGHYGGYGDCCALRGLSICFLGESAATMATRSRAGEVWGHSTSGDRAYTQPAGSIVRERSAGNSLLSLRSMTRELSSILRQRDLLSADYSVCVWVLSLPRTLHLAGSAWHCAPPFATKPRPRCAPLSTSNPNSSLQGGGLPRSPPTCGGTLHKVQRRKPAASRVLHNDHLFARVSWSAACRRLFFTHRGARAVPAHVFPPCRRRLESLDKLACDDGCQSF